MHGSRRVGAVTVMLLLAACGGTEEESAGPAQIDSAAHAWVNYHWARTSNPFTLKLGDNLGTSWKSFLTTASSDWSQSAVLDTTIVAGLSANKRCRATTGRVEVCNGSYGQNGWLGIASISVSGSHITAGTVRLNDTYFSTARYNTPSWRLFVMCQEVGHTFGLDHQDEVFANGNLGSCMDYTDNPDGPPSNLHPNQHDYDQLAAIYAHLDGTTTVGAALPGLPVAANEHAGDGPAAWGRLVRTSAGGRVAVYERDLGAGLRVITFVIWA